MLEDIRLVYDWMRPHLTGSEWALLLAGSAAFLAACWVLLRIACIIILMAKGML